MRGRHYRSTCIRVCVTLILGLASSVPAQTAPPADRVAQLLSDAASRLGQASQSRRVELTLDDAIERALQRNLDIAVQRITPQVFDLAVAEQLAYYRPTVVFGYDTSSATSPSAFQLDGGLITLTDNANVNVGVSQPVKWGGGRLDVGFDNNRRETTNTFSSFNPSFRSVFVARYRQPLLRGFNVDSVRQGIQVTRINREISDIDLRQTIANTVSSVQHAYWQLLYAVAAADVQRQALALAEQLVLDNQERVEVGTLAPIDVVQAQTEAAARRQQVALAEQALDVAALTLKQLIVDGMEDELWTAEIMPVDQPQLGQPPIDIEAAVRTALTQRTDLLRAMRQQDINQLDVDMLRNRTLPALDLVGVYQLQGQGGNFLVRGAELGGEVVDVIPGGYADAFRQIADADFPIWSVSLQLSYPLGTSSDEAALERARLQVRQTDVQLRQLQLAVATEVTRAGLQINSIQKRIDAAIAARELAEMQLAAEERRFEVGRTTNFFVVQAQRDLATAQELELRAILDYQRALIEFERVQRTSLGNAGISFVGGIGEPGGEVGSAMGDPAGQGNDDSTR